MLASAVPLVERKLHIPRDTYIDVIITIYVALETKTAPSITDPANHVHHHRHLHPSVAERHKPLPHTHTRHSPTSLAHKVKKQASDIQLRYTAHVAGFIAAGE